LPFSPFIFKSPSVARFNRLFNSTGLQALRRRFSSALLPSDASEDSGNRSQGVFGLFS
jgi:hypothetical protein